MEIYDLRGKLILQDQLEQQAGQDRMDLRFAQPLSSGVYTVLLRDRHGFRATRKLLIE